MLFFGSKPGVALHLKRLKRLCRIRPCIVIYAFGSSKRETKECCSQRDGKNSTSSPRLKVWKYLCDRPKTSTFAETVLQNWENVHHLLSKQKNWKQNWKALVQAKIRLHSNEIIAVYNLLDYFDGLLVSNRDRWHSHVVYMPNLVFHQRSQQRKNQNQRFALAGRQIYKNILASKKFVKRIFLFRWKIINFKLLSHGFERFLPTFFCSCRHLISNSK